MSDIKPRLPKPDPIHQARLSCEERIGHVPFTCPECGSGRYSVALDSNIVVCNACFSQFKRIGVDGWGEPIVARDPGQQP
jgi:hypothetical protein